MQFCNGQCGPNRTSVSTETQLADTCPGVLGGCSLYSECRCRLFLAELGVLGRGPSKRNKRTEEESEGVYEDVPLKNEARLRQAGLLKLS